MCPNSIYFGPYVPIHREYHEYYEARYGNWTLKPLGEHFLLKAGRWRQKVKRHAPVFASQAFTLRQLRGFRVVWRFRMYERGHGSHTSHIKDFENTTWHACGACSTTSTAENVANYWKGFVIRTTCHRFMRLCQNKSWGDVRLNMCCSGAAARFM